MTQKYSDKTRDRSIELLLDGKTIDEVTEETGVNRNTLMSWRQQEKKQSEVDFPTHYSNRERNNKFVVSSRYSDAEIISLARQNPGYGIERFCKELYPRTKKLAEIRYRITMFLQDYCSESGEDLFDLLQDPDFSEIVSAYEYREITGKSRLPQGHGRSNARSSKVSEGFGKGTRKSGAERNIPLPPQKFNWGEIDDSENRPRHNLDDL